MFRNFIVYSFINLNIPHLNLRIYYILVWWRLQPPRHLHLLGPGVGTTQPIMCLVTICISRKTHSKAIYIVAGIMQAN